MSGCEFDWESCDLGACWGPDCPHFIDPKERPEMKVTAKFTVVSREPGYDPDECTVINCYPDYADDRNKEWAWATPAGSIELTIRNGAPAADFFELGKSLLVTFEEDAPDSV